MKWEGNSTKETKRREGENGTITADGGDSRSQPKHIIIMVGLRMGP